MGLINYLKWKARRWSLPLPFDAPSHQYSTIAWYECNTSDRLLDISLKAIQEARTIDMAWLCKRMKDEPRYPKYWPGEHYKLLAGFVKTLKPSRVVEVGTFSGLSALAMKAYLPTGAEIVTFDIIPWDQIPENVLSESDFRDGTLRQVIGDLSDEQSFASHSELLKGCELFFIDGPKNVTFEEIFLRRLSQIKFPKNPIVILDDIRVWNMLKIWHEISRPKLDMTSFGHFSGTGIIDWKNP